MCSILLCGFLVQRSRAESVYAQVSTYFLSLDSLVEVITRKVSRIDKLDPTDKLFQEMTTNREEFSYLMRTNSKGKIISKVIGSKVASRNYRYIGDQSWFKTISVSKKPYYGNISQKKGVYLFWNRPLFVRTNRGTRFGGTVAAKISLHSCFKAIAEEHSLSFQVLYRKKTLFSNVNKSNTGKMTTQKLAIYGIPGLQLRYAASGATFSPAQKPAQPVAQAGEKVQATPEKTVVPTGKADTKTVGVKKKSKKPQKQTTAKTAPALGKKAEKKKSGPGGPLVLILIILLCAVVVVVCVVVMKRATEKRRKLIEAIDKGEI